MTHLCLDHHAGLVWSLGLVLAQLLGGIGTSFARLVSGLAATAAPILLLRCNSRSLFSSISSVQSANVIYEKVINI